MLGWTTCYLEGGDNSEARRGCLCLKLWVVEQWVGGGEWRVRSCRLPEEKSTMHLGMPLAEPRSGDPWRLPRLSWRSSIDEWCYYNGMMVFLW
uniref:Aco2 n=1 Tax=Arundo donax TaxID=35708 RepID=A0A0A9QRY1_ARUDO